MERILVAGGTGLAGRAVAAEALRRGHSVRVLSRHEPKPGGDAHQAGAEYVRGDVCSGEGLAAALAKVDVVIDTLNAPFRSAGKRLAPGARNLTAAMSAAQVQWSVLLSIVNVDQCSLGYYQAKTAQERVYAAAPVETVIVRTTQFHNLVASMIRPMAALPVFLASPGSRCSRSTSRMWRWRWWTPQPHRACPMAAGSPLAVRRLCRCARWQKYTGKQPVAAA